MTTHSRDRIRRSGRLLLVAWIGVLSLFVPTVAHAIVYGEETEVGEYANVGSFVMLYDPGTGGATYPVQLCTGTLISPTVVLSAAHCLQRDELPAAYLGDPWFTLDPVIDADGNWTVDPGVTRLEGVAHPHPQYAAGHNYQYDVGVFVLDIAVTGVAPATLARVGDLNDRAMRGARFTAVGYGIVRETNKKSSQSFRPPQRRMKASQTLLTTNRDFAFFSMNLATGNGGTCYGDSGGPHFAANGDIVSITTTGDIPCKASDKSFRVDTWTAQDFLRTYLD